MASRSSSSVIVASWRRRDALDRATIAVTGPMPITSPALARRTPTISAPLIEVPLRLPRSSTTTVSPPPDRGVAARHRLVLDHHAGLGAAPEHQLGAVVERDHPGVVLIVQGDDQVPGTARRWTDDRVQ